ncbi:MAG TPA: polyprenyl synthetase family protein [Propionibacteriaceae bacterium]|nr:polyprenyl synthetase family protein [Propionibacteriaceae bacterium]
MISSRSASSDFRAVLDPSAPASPAFRAAISAKIGTFLDAKFPVVAAMGPELIGVHRMARELLTGGKRLRPAFCVWGYVAAAGHPAEPNALLSAAASLDLLHVSALVHDDVMDSSDLRRGQPAAHRQFEALHDSAGWLGERESFGRAGAILLGDLLVMWSVEMLSQCGLPDSDLRYALPVVEAMRTEVTCGQYLDVLAQVHPLRADDIPPRAHASQPKDTSRAHASQPKDTPRAHASGPEDATPSAPDQIAVAGALADASRVVEFKSARYTVQRPCQFGAALAGADQRLQSVLAAYGSPLGRAFQFRDDLLGVFGDPLVTGKPSGDDLREGKRTVLIAHAYARSDSAGRDMLAALLGNPALDEDGVAILQELISSAGAREAVERMIEDGYSQAMEALARAEISDEGRTALSGLADAAVRRTF